MYDAPVLNAWISASQTISQTYNNTTQVYTPNYATSAQVLTLNLTKAGSASSIIDAKVKNVKWFKREGTTTTEITSTTVGAEYKSGTSNSILTTKANVKTEHNAIIWSVEGTWTDPATGLDVPFSASINLTLVQLAKASVVASLSAPNGDFFRNNTPSSLKITCDIYKDGDLSAGSRKYKWFASDPSLSTSQDTDAGVGWRKITATTGTTGAVASSGFDVAVTTQGVLTVYPDAVVNAQTFMIVATDNAGGNAGTKMKQYITLKDMDDPIMVVVESTGGNIIKNGAGSTTLKARLLQNGEEIDSGGTAYTYNWYKYENNVKNPDFGGTGVGVKKGKTLSVGSADINSTATFIVEVEPK